MQLETTMQIQFVHGGFILQTEDRTEVFASPGKLLKAVRGLIDEKSLVKKEKTDGAENAD